jgi:magnesium transporter
MKLFAGGDTKRKVVTGVAECDASEILREDTIRALHSQNGQELLTILRTHHSADIADVIEGLTLAERRLLISLTHDQLVPGVLAALEDWARDDVIEHLSSQEIATAIRGLESDDALTIVESLDPKRQKEVLHAMSREERSFLEKSLAYPKDSAGRLMQHEVLSMPDCATVADLKTLLAGNHVGVPITFYEIFIYDPLHFPTGSIPLHRILRVAPHVLLREIMDPQPLCIPAILDQEHVGNLFRQYGLVSAPVVNDRGYIVGMITVDDVVAVLEEEAEEDLLYLTGAGVSDFRASILETSFDRLRWLVITLINTLLASTVIYQFQFALKKMIALAVLMPIVAAMGGNAGMQVVTVTVRALATRQLGLHKKAIIAAVVKELRIGLANSLIFSLPLGALIAWWFQDWRLGIVLSTGMIFNIIWASAAGTLIPLFFAKLKIDPAVAAGPLLTTTTDVLGYLVFLSLAVLLLV